MHKHTRPFRCIITDCKGNSGFATKGVLDRHMRRIHRNSRSVMSDHSSATEVANALTVVGIGETIPESIDPTLAVPDKGKGKSKRMFAGDVGVQHASEEYEESTGSRSDLKKAKLVVCDCSHQVSRLEADLVKEKGEKEKLQQELKTIQEELARYQREQDTLLGIIERLRK